MLKDVFFCIFLVGCFECVRSQGSKPLLNISNATYLRTPELTCDDIKFIVDFHNNGRKLLATGKLERQPKASNMQRIVWDEALANKATEWTKQMVLRHNPNLKEKRFSVGENLFMTAGTNTKSLAVEWKRPLNAWFNEHVYYTFQPAYDDPITAHYTQMIWANIIYVGCGTTQFLDSRNWLYKYYVCNYGPSGNWYGSYPYFEEDSDELAILRDAGIFEDIVMPNCDNLCCDFGQCKKLYGPNCSF